MKTGTRRMDRYNILITNAKIMNPYDSSKCFYRNMYGISKCFPVNSLALHHQVSKLTAKIGAMPMRIFPMSKVISDYLFLHCEISEYS